MTTGKPKNPGMVPEPELPRVVRLLEADLWKPETGAKAVKALEKLLESKNPKVKFHAAKLILERMYGRPRQTVVIEGNVSHLHAVLDRAKAAELVTIDATASEGAHKENGHARSNGHSPTKRLPSGPPERPRRRDERPEVPPAPDDRADGEGVR